jgi:hypothetical protein
MGRQQLLIALSCVLGTVSLWNEPAVGGSLLHLKLGKPDISSDNIQITYDATTHIFTATGAAELLNGSSATHNATTDKFYLDALIDNTGHLISNTANLQVTFGGTTWFKSGSSGVTDLSHANANNVSFGYGTGLMEFAFFQNSFGQAAPVPAAGNQIDVELHASRSFTGFGSSFLPGSGISNFDTTSDTAVAAPAPKPALLGFMLFGMLAAGGLVQRRCRAHTKLAS